MWEIRGVLIRVAEIFPFCNVPGVSSDRRLGALNGPIEKCPNTSKHFFFAWSVLIWCVNGWPCVLDRWVTSRMKKYQSCSCYIF